MIEKALEKLRNRLSDVVFEKATQEVNESYFDGMAYAYGEAMEIVQEVTKEYEDKASEARQEFMGIVYDELADDADNYRANRIIDAFDTYAPYQKGE